MINQFQNLILSVATRKIEAYNKIVKNDGKWMRQYYSLQLIAELEFQSKHR